MICCLSKVKDDPKAKVLFLFLNQDETDHMAFHAVGMHGDQLGVSCLSIMLIQVEDEADFNDKAGTFLGDHIPEYRLKHYRTFTKPPGNPMTPMAILALTKKDRPETVPLHGVLMLGMHPEALKAFNAGGLFHLEGFLSFLDITIFMRKKEDGEALEYLRKEGILGEGTTVTFLPGKTINLTQATPSMN